LLSHYHFFVVALVGGSTPNEGAVYAYNPKTGIYGAVCHDGGWNLKSVIL